MKCGVVIRVTPEVSMTMTELELSVLGHLMGYDVLHVLKDVTGKHTKEQLVEVAYSMRQKCEAATELIKAARSAINQNDAVRKAAERVREE